MDRRMGYLAVGIFSVDNIHNKNQLFLDIDSIEQAVIADPVTKDRTKVAFQAFDIRSQERIITQGRIDIILDFGITRFIDPRDDLLLKSQGLSNPEITRRFDSCRP